MSARLLGGIAALLVAASASGFAQRGQSPPSQTPQQAAALDLTGYWVSIITEDWRVRMVTPPKG
jgi:hypothetical protein